MAARLLLAALLLATTGCSREHDVEQAQYNTRVLVYTKDDRTGLCFASWETSHRAGMAEVPCEKVEKYLDK
jgi:hypothetical protein